MEPCNFVAVVSDHNHQWIFLPLVIMSRRGDRIRTHLVTSSNRYKGSWLTAELVFVAFDKEVCGKMVRKQPSDLNSLKMVSVPDLIPAGNPYTYLLTLRAVSAK
jgi:hypothetical protein